MKHLTLHKTNNPTDYGSFVPTKVEIHSAHDKACIAVSCREFDGLTAREMSLIEITLPSGRKWSGTVTDFETIFNAVKSTRDCVAQDHSVYFANEVSEMNLVLSHFS